MNLPSYTTLLPNQEIALKLLKMVLVFISVFHLFFGFGLMFSVSFQQFAITNYGGTLNWNVTTIYFIRIIGSFAFVLGYLAWMASLDPQKYKIIVIGFVEFFILRNICRHLFADELYAALNVSPFINVMTSVFFGVQAVLLAYLLWGASIVKPDTGNNNHPEILNKVKRVKI